MKQAVITDTLELLAYTLKELKGSYKNVQFQHSKLRAVWIGEKKSKEISA